MISQLTTILLSFSQSLGYGGIVFLMAIESSFIPFPSEIVIPPAAYLASQGNMNIYLVAAAGILGSLIGAVINYFLALTLGRSVIYALSEKKFAKLILIDSVKIKKAETYFLKYGNISTLIGRLIPAVRQLISLPAGFSRMPLRNFIFYTFLGSSIWNIVLAVLGYQLGANSELLKKYYSEISHVMIVLGAALIIFFSVKYYLVKRRNRTSKNSTNI